MPFLGSSIVSWAVCWKPIPFWGGLGCCYMSSYVAQSLCHQHETLFCSFSRKEYRFIFCVPNVLFRKILCTLLNSRCSVVASLPATLTSHLPQGPPLVWDIEAGVISDGVVLNMSPHQMVACVRAYEQATYAALDLRQRLAWIMKPDEAEDIRELKVGPKTSVPSSSTFTMCLACSARGPGSLVWRGNACLLDRRYDA